MWIKQIKTIFTVGHLRSPCFELFRIVAVDRVAKTQHTKKVFGRCSTAQIVIPQKSGQHKNANCWMHVEQLKKSDDCSNHVNPRINLFLNTFRAVSQLGQK